MRRKKKKNATHLQWPHERDHQSSPAKIEILTESQRLRHWTTRFSCTSSCAGSCGFPLLHARVSTKGHHAPRDANPEAAQAKVMGDTMVQSKITDCLSSAASPGRQALDLRIASPPQHVRSQNDLPEKAAGGIMFCGDSLSFFLVCQKADSKNCKFTASRVSRCQRRQNRWRNARWLEHRTEQHILRSEMMYTKHSVESVQY